MDLRKIYYNSVGMQVNRIEFELQFLLLDMKLLKIYKRILKINIVYVAFHVDIL
jgi:hypothetical protein